MTSKPLFKKTLLSCVTVFIFLWATALRCIEVLNHNYLFGFDQGRDYLAAYAIAVTHKLTLIGSEIGAGSAGLNGIFHGPGYYYLLALMFILFHGDPYGGLLLMFVFGIATLFVVYVTTVRMFGKKTGTVSLFLVGISPLIVSQSRFLWNHHPSSFFIVLTLYFVYMISKNPRVYAPLALVTGGFIYHFELAIAVPVVVAIWMSLPLIFRSKDVRTYLFSLASTVFSFLPFIVFDSRHGWLALRALSGYLVGGSGNTTGISWIRISGHLQAYLNNAANSFMFEFIPAPLSKIFSAGIFVALLLLVIKTKDVRRRLFFRFLLLLLIVSYGILLFLNNSVWDYYLIHAHFVYIYVCAYLVVLLFSKLRNNIAYGAGFILLCAFLLLMTWSSVKRMYVNIRYDWTDLGGVEKIEGKRIAIDYVYRDAKGTPFSEFTFMPPIYTYPYEYLFKTYGKDTYGYVPGNEKKGLVYLIIEPDNSKPWTYKGWLETVIVGGDIVETKTLHTGHIIQKRLFP